VVCADACSLSIGGFEENDPVVIHLEYGTQTQCIAVAVVKAAAVVHNVDPRELSPIAETGDPETLDALVGSRAAVQAPDLEGTFTEEWLEVSVTGDGDIWLRWASGRPVERPRQHPQRRENGGRNSGMRNRWERLWGREDPRSAPHRERTSDGEDTRSSAARVGAGQASPATTSVGDTTLIRAPRGSRRTTMDQQEEVRAFVERHGLDAPPAYRLLDLVSEVGELAKDAAESTGYGSTPACVDVADDEVGDALFALLALADGLDVDAGEALDEALAKYERRLDEDADPSSGR
jgi:NTP pyrophosphatase (non-canonical NTP hydrolase)